MDVISVTKIGPQFIMVSKLKIQIAEKNQI